VGCRAPILGQAPEGAFRVVLGLAEAGGNGVAVDLAGRSFGRGAHLHAEASCLAKACSGGFSKAFRRNVVVDKARLERDLSAAADRRIEGLLLGARRASLLAFGEEARGLAGSAPLVVVARDAGPSVLRGPVRQAIASGRVLAWGTEETLGSLFSRELVAIVVVRHASVAREVRRARGVTESLGVADS
jgi:predicted RNA-binding protein YlxR (DUF448 family)